MPIYGKQEGMPVDFCKVSGGQEMIGGIEKAVDKLEIATFCEEK